MKLKIPKMMMKQMIFSSKNTKRLLNKSRRGKDKEIEEEDEKEKDSAHQMMILTSEDSAIL